MKRILIYLVLLITMFSCTNDDSKPDYRPNENVTISETEMELFNQINDYRLNNNLSVLKLEFLTTELAIEHTEYMILNDSISHDYFQNRYDRSGADRMGEIVAYGFIVNQSLLSAYLTSPPHKAIIDNPVYSHMGISKINMFNTCIFTSYK